MEAIFLFGMASASQNRFASGYLERFGLQVDGSEHVMEDEVFRPRKEYGIKKRSPSSELLIKMGGDLLFHKQVQYHQRGRA